MKRTYKHFWVAGGVVLALLISFLAWWILQTNQSPAKMSYVSLIYKVQAPARVKNLDYFWNDVAKVLSGRLILDVLPMGEDKVQVQVPSELWGRVITEETLNAVLRPMGRLEFRIAARLNGDNKGFRINDGQLAQYLKELRNGISQKRNEARFAWFPVCEDVVLSKDMVAAKSKDKNFLLLCDKPGFVMTYLENGWEDLEILPANNGKGQPAVMLKLSEAVTKQFSKLSLANKGSHVVLLVCDEVFGTLSPKGSLSNELILSGSFSDREVTKLFRNIYSTTNLPPILLKLPPLSIKNVGDCGKDNMGGAMVTHKKAIEIDSKNVAVYRYLGGTLQREGDIDGAIAAFKKVIELEPEDADAYNSLGIELISKGDADGAIAAYKKVIELEPKDADAYCSLGDALMIKKDYDSAVTAYKKFNELRPCFYSYTQLGWALRAKGDFDGAITAYKKVIELKPGLPSGYNGLGLVLWGKGDHDGAISTFKKTIEIDSKNANAHHSLAWAYYHKKDYDKAWEVIRIARSKGLGNAINPKLLEDLKKASSRKRQSTTQATQTTP